MTEHSSLIDFEKKLVRLIKERASIIWVKTFYKEAIYDIIDKYTLPEGGGEMNLPRTKILTWNIANGQVVFGASEQSCENYVQLTDTLLQFKRDDEHFDFELLILDDISNLLTMQEEANTLIGILQEFAYINSRWNKADRSGGIPPRQRKSIIIISPKLEIVENLTHLVEILEEPIPDEKDIERELGFDTLKEHPEDLRLILKSKESTYAHGRYAFARSFLTEYESLGKKLVSALSGMYIYDIRRVLYSLHVHSKADYKLQNHEGITGKKTLHSYILEEKKRIVQNSGLLQVVDIDNKAQREKVGSIDSLRKFLEVQKKIIDNIEHFNRKMRKPKGILLVGAPGCGKSETAKSVAAILEKPLLRLDIGALMGQYVGVSEHNLIEALKIAEAAQPCVLWIDEIEKAFAGFGNSDSGNDITVMRMVGYFLTWMQERNSLVYLVATANNLDNLRPELLRKGRWDKIYYLSYPDKKGIVDIFSRCLKTYGLTLDAEEIAESDDLIELMYEQEMSGADIESVIVEAYNKAFSENPLAPVIQITRAACLEIVKSTNVLEARHKADERLIREELDNYKIQNRLLEWDIDPDEAKRKAVAEYRLANDVRDFTRSTDELVNEALEDVKISAGKTTLENVEEVKNLLRAQLRREKKKYESASKMVEDKVDNIYREKETVRKHITAKLSYKSREEQEKYFKAKGYESASSS